MTHDPTTPSGPDTGDRILDAAIEGARLGPSAEETSVARDRARARLFASGSASPCDAFRPDIAALVAGTLGAGRATLVADHCSECVPCRREMVAARDGSGRPGPAAAPLAPRRRRAWLAPAAGMAAAALVATFVGLRLLGGPVGVRPQATAAVVEVRGQLLLADTGEPAPAGATIGEGRAVRTAKGSRAVLALPDGSRVELNERAQASFDADGEALTVALDRGDIIFEAARRKERNLYVRTADCTVAVKGTVFTVRHGLKGSRVGVLEGSVHVDRSGQLSVLGPGDQVATDPSLVPQSLDEQVAWSLDASRWTDLLHEIDAAAAAVEHEASRPAPRHDSTILDAMPDSTVLFAAAPNGGDLARLAGEISERVASNPRLAEWWQAQLDPSAEGANFARALDVLRRLSEALGEEVVFALLDDGVPGQPPMPVLVAGLRDETGLMSLLADVSAKATGNAGLRVLTAEQLAELPSGPVSPELVLVVHAGHVLAGPSADALRAVVAGLDSPAQHGTRFLASLEGQYDRGAEFLVGADVGRVLARRAEAAAAQAAAAGREQPGRLVEALGIPSVDQFVLTAGAEDPGTAVLSFRGDRTGVASWLADPGPMGSLQFVTPEASVAAAALFRDPALMLGDLESMLPEGKLDDLVKSLADETGVDLRADVVASLGGEMALALDGPVLPSPAWKLVLEVDDPARFESALETLAREADAAARERGSLLDEAPVVRQTRTTEGPARALRIGVAEVHYAIRDGYFVATPNQTLLEAALAAKRRGTSLASSPALTRLLPGGEREELSLVAWQDLSRTLGEISRSGSLAGLLPAEAVPLLSAADAPAIGWARASDRAIAFGVNGTGGGLGGGLATLLRRHVVSELSRHALTGEPAAGEDAPTGIPAR